MVDETSKRAKTPRARFKTGGFDEESVQYGRDLVTHLCILMKTAQIHDPSNIALVNSSENLMQTLRQLWRWNERVYLRLVGDYLFIDELRLRMDIERFVSFTFVIEELKRAQIGGIVFLTGISPDELRRFVYLMVQADSKGDDSFDSIIERIKRAGITNVEIERLEETKEEYKAFQKNRKELAKSSYFKTLTTVSEVMESIKLGRAVSLKRAKRSVQTMVDLLLTDESTLLGLTTLRCHDLYTHNHSVNVCILALAMGQRMGYTPKQSTLLGMAGLFHDMGKATIPLDILNKPTEFTEENWTIMRRHPIEGVKHLLRLKGINEMAIRIATGAFEHHLNYDLSGYPKLEGPWEVSLLGRIISIVDCYDALTSSRVYNRIPFSPDRALKFMLSKSGKAFDPILLKVFVNCIGIFPIGTLVLLNTRELAVVLETHPYPEKAGHPRVKIIADPDGRELDGDIVDLYDSKEISQRSIIKTVDPTKHKADVSRYFT